MQFALTTNPTKTVQAATDAPRYAQCVWCGMPVELYHQKNELMSGYSYIHTSDLSLAKCLELREQGQAELDEVLGVKQ